MSSIKCYILIILFLLLISCPSDPPIENDIEESENIIEEIPDDIKIISPKTIKDIDPSIDVIIPTPKNELCNKIKEVFDQINHLPYVWGGDEIKDGGLDCSGMVFLISKKIGRPLPRTTSKKYYLTMGNEDHHWNDAECTWWTWWTFTPDRPYGHVGIHLEQPEFIHSGSSTGPTTATHWEGGYWDKIHESSRKVYE